MENDAVSKITETARERVQVGLKQQPLDVKEVAASLGKWRQRVNK